MRLVSDRELMLMLIPGESRRNESATRMQCQLHFTRNPRSSVKHTSSQLCLLCTTWFETKNKMIAVHTSGKQLKLSAPLASQLISYNHVSLGRPSDPFLSIHKPLHNASKICWSYCLKRYCRYRVSSFDCLSVSVVSF